MLMIIKYPFKPKSDSDSAHQADWEEPNLHFTVHSGKFYFVPLNTHHFHSMVTQHYKSLKGSPSFCVYAVALVELTLFQFVM